MLAKYLSLHLVRFLFLFGIFLLPGVGFAQTVTLSSSNPSVPSAYLLQSSTMQPIYRAVVSVGGSNGVNFSNLTFTPSGSFVTSDFSYASWTLGYRVWASKTDNLSTATQISNSYAAQTSGTQISMAINTPWFAVGETWYVWITADISSSAVSGHTLTVAALTTSNFTFSAGTKSGTMYIGGTQTLGPPPKQFRSQASGNWNATSTWQQSTDGGTTWSAATTTPLNTDGLVTVQSGHTVTITANAAASNLVDNGAITINSYTLTPAVATINGVVTASGNSATLALTTATVNGTITVSGSSASVTAAGTVVFASGSSYVHARNGGAIPAATWNAGSTCNVTGMTSTNVTGLNQTFGNFTWNCASQTGNLTLSGNMVVNGDFTLTAGTFALNSASSRTLTIGGNYNQTGGIFNFNRGSSGNSNVYLAGNLNNTAGSGSMTTSGNANNGVIVFNGSGQTLNMPVSGASTWVDYSVNNGSLVQLLSSIALEGSTINVDGTLDAGTYVISDINGTYPSDFSLNSGAVILTANTGGLVLSTSTYSGSVQTRNSRTYDPGANYIYNGTSAQVTGTGLTGAASLTINNSAGVSLSAATSVSGNVNLTSGILTTTSTYLLTVTNTSVSAITGASATSFINGPLKQNLPASLASGSTYTFPVGAGTSYLPFSLVNPTTGTGTPTATVQAFAGSCGGSYASGSLSLTEYWTLTTTGNFTNSSVSLTRQTPVAPFNLIMGGTSLAGTYSSLGGTAGGYGVSGSAVIGTNRYFTFGTTTSGFWYRADAGTSTITDGAGLNTWYDQSGLANNATPGPSNVTTPVYQASGWNFNPMVSFTNGYYLTTNNGIANDMTFLIVYNSTQTAGSTNFYQTPALIGGETNSTQYDYQLGTNAGKLFFKGTSGDNFGAQTAATYNDGKPRVVAVTRQKSSSGNIYLYVNGTQAATAVSDNSTLSDPKQLGIGNSYGYQSSAQFVGGISEVYGNNSVFTATARQSAESYLAIKYGITLTHDYTDGSGNTVYSISGYANDVAGLAADATYGLNQMVSGSVNTSLGTSTSRVIMSTTNDFTSGNLSASRTALTNGQYLVWGHNNGSTSSWTTSGSFSVVNRIWKVQNTGNAGAVSFQIDLTGYPAAPSGVYALLVDDDGNFANGGTTEYIMQSSGALNSATVTFPAGTSYFTVTAPTYSNAVYVRVGGYGLKNGTSWANAMPTVQQAVETSNQMTTKLPVYVAAGNYYRDPNFVAGDYGTYTSGVWNGLANNFLMRDGVNVLGAFPEYGTSNNNNADTTFRAPLNSSVLYKTILNGGNNQRVLGVPLSYNSGSFTFSNTTTWNGFTLTGAGITSSGVADDDCGGGVFTIGKVVIKNCVLENNTVSGGPNGADGSAAEMTGGTLLNCIIRNNTAGSAASTSSAGTVNIRGGGSSVINCLIYGNNAYMTGGGVSLNLYENTTVKCYLINNTIANNVSTSSPNGSGIYIFNGTGYICFYNNAVWNNAVYGVTVGNEKYNGWPNTGGTSGTGSLILSASNGSGTYPPDFVNPTTDASADYRLLPSSALFNAGGTIAQTGSSLIPATDIRSVFRDAAPDMGCYELASKYYYVNNATGMDVAGYGLNWSAPYATLQYAISQYDANENPQIFVAQGNAAYLPSSVTGFQMLANLSVFGGFAGTPGSEPVSLADLNNKLNGRTLKTNETVLSGNGNVTSVINGSSVSGAVYDGFTVTGCSAASASTSANLALGKTVVVSSLENGNIYPGSAVVDGATTGARWSSAFSDPQWIYVDLGAVYNINEVTIYWETAYGKDFKIQTSIDLNTWNDIYTVTGNNLPTDPRINDFTGLTGVGRYVRIYGTARATGYGYSIYELQIFQSVPTTPCAVSFSGASSARNLKIVNNGADGLSVGASSAAYNILSVKNGGNGVVLNGNASLVNATIADNTGYGINCGSPSASVTNSILWKNGNGNLTGSVPNITYSAATSDYASGYASNIWNANATTTHNIELYHRSPNFKQSSGNNYELLLISPCLAKGLASANTQAMDANGKPRVYGSAIDLGAFQKWDGYTAQGSTSLKNIRKNHTLSIANFTISNDTTEILVPPGITLDMGGVTNLKTKWIELQQDTIATQPAQLTNGTMLADSLLYVRRFSKSLSGNGVWTFFGLPFNSAQLTQGTPASATLANTNMDGALDENTVRIEGYNEYYRAYNGANGTAWTNGRILPSNGLGLAKGKGYALSFNSKVPQNDIGQTIIFPAGSTTVGKTGTTPVDSVALSVSSVGSWWNQGWNLISNPLFLQDTIARKTGYWPVKSSSVNYYGAVYLYKSATDSYSVYPLSTFNKSGSTALGLSAYGACFVQGDMGGSQVYFKGVSGGTPYRSKALVNPSVSSEASDESSPSLFGFNVVGSGQDYDTYVMFADSAHADARPIEDAPMMTGLTGRGPLLMNTVASDMQLAINTLPFTGTTMEIPLQVSVPSAGNYTISMPESDTIATVYLKDPAGKLTNLNAGNYSFTVNDVSQTYNFTLVFSRAARMQQAASNGVIIIQNRTKVSIFSNDPILQVMLYGAAGQLLGSLEDAGVGTVVDLPTTAGIYLLKVTNVKGTMVKKLVNR
jgi:hypothetical protein